MTVIRPGATPQVHSPDAPKLTDTASVSNPETRPAISGQPTAPSDAFTSSSATQSQGQNPTGLREPRGPSSQNTDRSQLNVPPPPSETIETKGGFLTTIKDFLGFGESVNNQVNPQMDLSYALSQLGHTKSVVGRSTLRGEAKDVRLRTAAHLLGIGGQLQSPHVRLEGLSRREASKTLDPIFREALELTRALVAQSPEHRDFSPALHQLVKSFREPTSHSRFIHDIQTTLRKSSSTAEHPCTWMTGWREPSGHAVGLVFDRVDGQNRIYLSNAGDEAFSSGETVKGFEISNPEQFLTTLKASGREDQLIRELWQKDGPALWGLKALKGDAQLPDKLQRSYQKRGNCPLASRKGCVLASLWSRRPSENPSADVKKTYKIFTTLLRRQGMELAIRENNTELIKRSFVTMLGKSDRPDCLRLLYHAADNLADSHGLFALEENWDKLESQKLRESPYLDYLQSVIKRAGIDIDAPDESGLSSYQRAKSLDRTGVVTFLKRLREA